MKIAVIVKNLFAQMPHHTTTHLVVEGLRLGHPTDLISGNDLTLTDTGDIVAMVPDLEASAIKSCSDLREVLIAKEYTKRPVQLGDYQLIFLRFNPEEWIQPKSELLANRLLDFAHIARQRYSSQIINDPAGLAVAGSKLHMTLLPGSIRPRSLVSRDAAAIKKFLRELHGPAIIKPLRGFGGSGVFYLDENETRNQNSIIETILHRDYCIVQQYVSSADGIEKRLLLIDGQPIRVNGQVAIYGRKQNADGDFRHNMSAGGSAVPCEYNADDENIANTLAPYLQTLGLRMVGVDIIGKYVLEINAFCPGGIDNCNRMYGINTGEAIIKHFTLAT